MSLKAIQNAKSVALFVNPREKKGTKQNCDIYAGILESMIEHEIQSCGMDSKLMW